jgi:hypothetical protein
MFTIQNCIIKKWVGKKSLTGHNLPVAFPSLYVDRIRINKPFCAVFCLCLVRLFAKLILCKGAYEPFGVVILNGVKNLSNIEMFRFST